MKFRAREVENPVRSRKENAQFSSFLYSSSSSFISDCAVQSVSFLSLSLSPLLPPLINPLPLREEAISLFFPPPPGIENDDTLFPASRSRGLAINYPSLLSFPPPFFNFLERRNPSPLPLCSSGLRMDPSRNNGNRKVELVSNTRNLCILERKNGGRSYNWWIFDFCIFDNGDDFLMYKIIFNIRSLENN